MPHYALHDELIEMVQYIPPVQLIKNIMWLLSQEMLATKVLHGPWSKRTNPQGDS